MDATILKLGKVDLAANNKDKFRTSKIKTVEDLGYVTQLAHALKNIGDIYDLRVESPWISIYTNDKTLVNVLAKIDESKIKYISTPPKDIVLDANMIIMSKRDFDYKVTMGSSKQEHSSFVQWADSNAGKVQLTKSCKRDLLRDTSWGGSHFYITGDNVLLMAKMHLGGSIAKIERITKQ